MRAAFTDSYGPADILRLGEAPEPTLSPSGVLIRVMAAPVTAGDRRMRSADFGPNTIPGRLVMGVTRPRNPIQGSIFAGRVVAVGSEVSRYRVGDDLFGFADHGAYAELVCLDEDAPMARLPEGFRYAQAAALPYGAGTALSFLTQLTTVRPGETVCILGASGGVGRFAVQIAKHLGAEVTAVAGRDQLELVRRLGADHAVDHSLEDVHENGVRYDVIFDLADVSSFSRARASLTPHGRYLTVYMGLGVLAAMAWTWLVGGQRALFTVAIPTRDDMETLRSLAEQGVLDPVMGETYELEQIVAAHRAAASARAEVTIVVGEPAPLRAVG